MVSGEAVMMFTTPRNASAPYSAEAGPRMISIWSTDDRGTSSTPSQLPEVVRYATERPSIITLTTPLSAPSPPVIPRTPAFGIM